VRERPNNMGYRGYGFGAPMRWGHWAGDGEGYGVTQDSLPWEPQQEACVTLQRRYEEEE